MLLTWLLSLFGVSAAAPAPPPPPTEEDPAADMGFAPRPAAEDEMP